MINGENVFNLIYTDLKNANAFKKNDEIMSFNKLHILLIAVTLGLNCKAQTQKGNDLQRGNIDDLLSDEISMPNNNTIAITSLAMNESVVEGAYVRVFNWDGAEWLQKGNDVKGTQELEYLGFPISMPDDYTFAVGASHKRAVTTNKNFVRVFHWKAGVWTQKGNDINGEGGNDGAGRSISMPDSNTVAVGATNNTNSSGVSGHVRIYKWDGNEWIQKGEDIDGTDPYQGFGWKVVMPDANTVAITTAGDKWSGSGIPSVHIYEWTGTAWIAKGVGISNGCLDCNFGSTLSMPNSNTIAIAASGTPANDGDGDVFGFAQVYNWEGGNWIQKGEDIIKDSQNKGFDWTVSMPDDHTIALRNQDDDSSSIKIYKWDNSEWSPIELDLNKNSNYENFGQSITMPDANTLAVSTRHNGVGEVGGASRRVQVFEVSNTVNVLENNFNESVITYPNPTYSNVYIDLGEVFPSVVVELRNELGQLISYNETQVAREINIDINGSPGVYFLKVIAGENKAFVRVLKK